MCVRMNDYPWIYFPSMLCLLPAFPHVSVVFLFLRQQLPQAVQIQKTVQPQAGLQKASLQPDSQPASQQASQQATQQASRQYVHLRSVQPAPVPTSSEPGAERSTRDQLEIVPRLQTAVARSHHHHARPRPRDVAGAPAHLAEAPAAGQPRAKQLVDVARAATLLGYEEKDRPNEGVVGQLVTWPHVLVAWVRAMFFLLCWSLAPLSRPLCVASLTSQPTLLVSVFLF